MYAPTSTSSRLLALVSLLVLLAAPRVAAADSITLMWDANPETDVAGYLVYVGSQPGTYGQPIDVGETTTFVLPNAVPGQRYCFAVSAYASGPLEGPKSSEVCGYSNTPPTIADPGNQTGTLGQPATLQLDGGDSDGTPVSYSASGLPPGLVLMASTGFISGTPAASGTYAVTATVSDGVLTASTSFAWAITAGDSAAPAISITSPTPASSHRTNQTTVTIGGTASDNTGVTQVSWVNSRGGSGIATGTTSWSASIALSSGTNVLTVRAFDAAGNSSTDALTVTVNVAPVLSTVGAQSSHLGQPTMLQLSASDANGDALTYGVTGLPPGLAVAAGTGQIAGTPSVAGTFPVTATVSDGLLSDSVSFMWTVTAEPTEGSLLLSWDSSTDPDVVGYRMHVGTEPGVYEQVIDVGLATTWQLPDPAPGQRYCFAVTAYTADGLESPRSNEVCGFGDQAPTLASVPDQTTDVGQAVSLQLAGSDPEGEPLSYGANGLPPGLGIMVGSGLITGTPTVAGTYAVTITVSDGTLTTSREFGWVVTQDATPPSVTITAPTSAPTFDASSSSITMSGSASDNRGVAQVRWTSDRGASGVASGTTSWSALVSLQGGVNVVTVTAEDVDGYSSTDVLTVTLNRGPSLAPVSAQSSEVGETVGLQVSGSDPDGDALTYGALGLPPGLSIAATGGLITGTPTTAGTYPVSVTVSDGALSASASFTWTVTANQAPVLAVVPDQTTARGAAVTLQFAGSDPDGDVLTYGALGLPPGLSLGASTGRVTGAAAVAGTYQVTATVSDGAQIATRSFAWTVTAPQDTGGPTVAITSPTTDEVTYVSSWWLTLGGTASDDVGVTEVRWESDRGGSGVANGTTSWSTWVFLRQGTNVLTLTALDAAGHTATDVITVIWGEPEPQPDTTAPVVAITNPTAGPAFTTTATTLQLAGAASDNEGVTAVSWSNNRGGSGTASGTTAWSAMVSLQGGVNVLTVTARDAAGNLASTVLSVTVETNRPPTLEPVANQYAWVKTDTSLQLAGHDEDGDALVYAATGLPAGFTLNAATGQVTGSPDDAGTYDVTVTVTDGVESASQSFTWVVLRGWGWGRWR